MLQTYPYFAVVFSTVLQTEHQFSVDEYMYYPFGNDPLKGALAWQYDGSRACISNLLLPHCCFLFVEPLHATVCGSSCPHSACALYKVKA